MDLTSEATLPVWLPVEAVGGKPATGVRYEDDSEDTNEMQRLSKALRAAASAQRHFRSISQWSASYLKYCIAAICMSQMSWAAAIAHMSIVYRIAEE